MKIAYIAAGAAGMYCGACIHDNTLAAALSQLGYEVPLIPTYTPTRTDEVNVSLPRVFFGGINVFLQQKFALFRHTPEWVDRVFDSPALLRLASKFAGSTNPAQLGELTVSMLRGEEGYQRKELSKLVAWLASEVRPKIVCLTNALLIGFAREIKRELRVPVVCGLPGEDFFLEGLPEPWRTQAKALLFERTKDVSAFIAMSEFYAGFMSKYLNVDRQRIHVVPPGLNLDGHGFPEIRQSRRAPTIGYLSRIAPEKGLHLLVEAWQLLRKQPGLERTRLRVAGYVSVQDMSYLENIRAQAGDDFDFLGELDRPAKIEFLRGLDVFSVPTVHPDCKGLVALEALANGVPFVEPAHGAFPELAAATGGGVVVEPNNPAALADGLAKLLRDSHLRNEMAKCGCETVHREFTDQRMAERTLEVFRSVLASGS